MHDADTKISHFEMTLCRTIRLATQRTANEPTIDSPAKDSDSFGVAMVAASLAATISIVYQCQVVGSTYPGGNFDWWD